MQPPQYLCRILGNIFHCDYASRLAIGVDSFRYPGACRKLRDFDGNGNFIVRNADRDCHVSLRWHQPLGTGVAECPGGCYPRVTTLPIGSNPITAIYPGDTNFSGSQAQLAGAIVVGAPGFSDDLQLRRSVGAGRAQREIDPDAYPGVWLHRHCDFGCAGMPGASTCAFQPASVHLMARAILYSHG